MARFDGSAALKLDFGSTTTTSGVGRGGLRLVTLPAGLRGPDKYKVLEHRRRQAQMMARRLLDIMATEEAQ